MAHSRFSPSATEREYSCPASFLINEAIPNGQSPDAMHGTAAHHVGELCLSKDRDVDFYAGCTLAVNEKGKTRFVTELHPPLPEDGVFEVDDEMVENVQKYVDWCRDLPGEHHVEIRVEHTDWCPDEDEHGFPIDPQFGTSDHTACIKAGERGYPEATLVVTDLKYGKGVRVWAKHNKQAIKYALGAWKRWNKDYHFKHVVIRIAQPRLDHMDVWELTVDELLVWGERIKQRLTLVFADEPVFGPSEKACKFCRNLACKPRDDYIFKQRAAMFDDFGEAAVDLHSMTEDELFAAYRMIPLLELRNTQIAAAVRKHLEDGDSVGDLVLKESTTHRKWNALKSEEDIVTALRKLGVPESKIYTERSLRSPAQIEDHLSKEKREKLKDLIVKPPGGPVIASPSDKRPLYVKPEVDLSMFDDEDDGFGD